MKVSQDMTTACDSCGDVLNAFPKFKVSKCNYEIHLECYIEHIKSQMDLNSFPIMCPNPKCNEHELHVNDDAINKGPIGQLDKD